MFKKRYFSAHSDFKTGIFCKLAFFFGIVLLIISLFFIVGSNLIGDGSSGITQQIYDYSQTTNPTSLLAFSFILFAVAVILYFFNCQLAKLSKIADEIEKGEHDEEVPEE